MLIRVPRLLSSIGMITLKRLRNKMDPIPVISTIHQAIEKIRKRGELNADTIKYFMMKNPKLARFYLLPKILKRLHNVPGRPVIPNCGYYTENISSFLDFGPGSKILHERCK